MSEIRESSVAAEGAHERRPSPDTARGRAALVDRPDLSWRLGGYLVLSAALVLAATLLVGLGLKQLGAEGLFGDLSIDRWLARNRTDALDDLTKVGSTLASTETAVAVAVVAFVALRLWLGRFYESCVLVVSLGGELLIFLAAAAIVGRPRPPVERLDAAPPTSSFPSGHTAASVALYGFIAVVLWRYASHRVALIAGLLLILIPPAVAASRMYRGMHYPSDVVAGALVGGVWLACVLWLLLPAPARVTSGP